MTDPQAIVLNIGPRQRRLRRRFGLAALAVGLVAAAAMIHFAVPRAYRLGLIFPFVLAGFGLLQAAAKT